MLKKAFMSLQISKFSGGACPQTPLAARAFGTRNLPRLVLKSGYGPDLICFYTEGLVIAFLSTMHY